MALFDMFKKKPKEPPKISTLPTAPGLHKEDFRIPGLDYHKDSIQKLAIVNPEWKAVTKKTVTEENIGKWIFHYNYVNKPVKLIPEDNNEFDKNAVAVYIAGEHVGYISSENNIHVRDILENGDIKYITAYITGGEAKCYLANGEVMTDKERERLKISVRIAYSVH